MGVPRGRVLDDSRRGARPRCLFVGLGSWGRRLLPRAAAAFDVVALVGTFRPDSVAWSAQNYPDIPYVDSLPKALTLSSLDAVFLVMPTPTNAALACLALDAGCHVFVEKPLAVNPEDAIEVLSRASERDLEVFIGYVYLFHPAVDYLRTVSSSHGIRSLRSSWMRPKVAGKLHEEILWHDIAVVVALADACRAASTCWSTTERTSDAASNCRLHAQSFPRFASTRAACDRRFSTFAAATGPPTRGATTT